MKSIRKNIRRQPERRGTALVETSVVLPVFFILIFGFIEFGHCFMTIHTLNSAARKAARLGVGENATTEQVAARAKEILGAAINTDLEGIQVMVKDASVFDQANMDPSEISYDELQDIEVSAIEPRQLFLVRIQVPYSEVGIMGPRWMSSLNLYGQAVMRKE
jgi:hypothetical protein